MRSNKVIISDPFTPDTSRQLHVFRHDGDSFGVDGAQIRIFEQTDHVGLACFLNCKNCLTLKPQVTLVLSCDLSDQSLEGKLANEELSRLLEFSDFSEGNGASSETMRLLDSFVCYICSLAS